MQKKKPAANSLLSNRYIGLPVEQSAFLKQAYKIEENIWVGRQLKATGKERRAKKMAKLQKTLSMALQQRPKTTSSAWRPRPESQGVPRLSPIQPSARRSASRRSRRQNTRRAASRAASRRSRNRQNATMERPEYEFDPELIAKLSRTLSQELAGGDFDGAREEPQHFDFDGHHTQLVRTLVPSRKLKALKPHKRTIGRHAYQHPPPVLSNAVNPLTGDTLYCVGNPVRGRF